MRKSLITPSYAMVSPWSLLREINSMFEEVSPDKELEAGLMNGLQQNFQPRSEVKETDKGYLMSFDLPGTKESDIKIEFKDHTLRIFGERKQESNVERKGYFHSEKVYGSFERSFRLPESIDDASIEANFHNGVLEVFLPKVEVKASKPITINTGSGNKNFIDRILNKKEDGH